MSTCGYVCPACDGKKMLESGAPCTWCIPDNELIELEEKEIVSLNRINSTEGESA